MLGDLDALRLHSRNDCLERYAGGWVDDRSTDRTTSDGTPRRHRILVVANETVSGRALLEAIGERGRGSEAEVLVVCPALSGRLRRWFSDVDDALANASQRLERSLAEIAQLGVAATGQIGDSDPVQAIDDALRVFPADEIVISTHPPRRSNWLERRVVERTREGFRVPVTHVIVDLERERNSRESEQHVTR